MTPAVPSPDDSDSVGKVVEMVPMGVKAEDAAGEHSRLVRRGDAVRRACMSGRVDKDVGMVVVIEHVFDETVAGNDRCAAAS